MENMPYKFLRKGDKIVLNLHGASINLDSLAIKFGSPLEVELPFVLNRRIYYLFQSFSKAVRDVGYGADLRYFYPVKVNPRKEFISEIIKSSDDNIGIEIGNVFELRLLLENFYEKIRHKKLVFHGPKSREYLAQILRLNDSGFDVTLVIEDLNELNTLKRRYSNKIKLGIRLNGGKGDRFGMSFNEATAAINEIKYDLSMVHIHFGENIGLKRLSAGVVKVMRLLTENSSNLADDIVLDFGGGLVFDGNPGSGTYKIEEYFKTILVAIKKSYRGKKGSAVHIAIESGSWVAAPAQMSIFSIIEVKRLSKSYRYVIDGSFMTDLPDTWGISKAWRVFPVNLLKERMVTSYLEGMTCDMQDVYIKDKPSPLKMPLVEPRDKNLFVCVAYTGAYQDALGNHHCAMPEPNKIILDEEMKIKKINIRRFENVERAFNYKI